MSVSTHQFRHPSDTAQDRADVVRDIRSGLGHHEPAPAAPAQEIVADLRSTCAQRG